MNPLQKAAVRRKAFYFAAILALFTISIFYRGLEAKTPEGSPYVWLPFGRDDRAGAGDSLARKTIVSQSRRLELRELDEGDPEIAGEAVRLGLVGSRGFAVTLLWYAAIEKQKRNDYHEFERLVKAVTTLQPHFITPWIFQSWNIAYNVSVEMHSLGDMYHYIARGIDLLAEGERRNRRSPDMRYQLAFYYQNKFGVSDQVQTLRCLFQLSCMPPDERNPESLTNPDGSVDMEKFKKFCQDHPMLVRRLRGNERLGGSDTRAASEALVMAEPKDVVQFLRDNRTVPGRYKNATELKRAEEQFPALPPQFNEGKDEAHPKSSASDLRESFSGYLAARAWFTYANTIVPPSPREGGVPVPSSAPTEFDPFKYRLPRMPVLIIFRQGPPRAQSYQAEMMQKDGWFDSDGWEIDGGVEDNNAWFTETVDGKRRKPGRQLRLFGANVFIPKPLVVGAGLPWSQEEWQRAHTRWVKHGYENGLDLQDNQLQQFRKDAGLPPGVDPVGLPPEPTPEQMADEAYSRKYKAISALYYYHSNRGLTNFAFYLAIADGEQQKETIQARKTLRKAEQERRVNNVIQAAKLYKLGLEQWRGVLIKYRDFHRTERLNKTEEDTYEYELEYLRLIALRDPLQEVRKKALEDYRAEYERKAKLVLAAGVIPFGVPGPVPSEIPLSIQDSWFMDTAEKHFAPFGGNITEQDVGAGDKRIGTPWILGYVKDSVRQRQGITKAPDPPKSAPPPGSGP